jgi:hypothetical protein
MKQADVLVDIIGRNCLAMLRNSPAHPQGADPLSSYSPIQETSSWF